MLGKMYIQHMNVAAALIDLDLFYHIDISFDRIAFQGIVSKQLIDVIRQNKDTLEYRGTGSTGIRSYVGTIRNVNVRISFHCEKGGSDAE